MLRKNRWGLLLAVALCLLSGCVTVGKKFDVDSVDQLQPQVSTSADAIQLLGPVTSETSYPNGAKLLQWQYSRGTPMGGGGGNVGILFDQNGKMNRLVQKTKIAM